MNRLVVTTIAFGASLAFGIGACGDDGGDTSGTPTGSSGATCAPSDPACAATNVASDCVALVDNSGQDGFALRLSQLSITAPAVLAEPLIASIVSDGVYLNAPSCNLQGLGTFNMLTIFDKTADTLTLAGAFPETDPSNGYCIVNDTANEVMPITVPANLMADGSFSTDPIDRIVVPIFLDLGGDLNNAVFLPLSQGRISGGQLSADQNCIGSFDLATLRPEFECAPDPEYFINGADLEGFITLEDADAVVVDVLQQSLCVVLSGDPNMYGDMGDPQRCTRDMNGAIVLQGDWCSTTNSAGGCADSFQLQARVAASAASVRSDCP
jgi:hypothetical protein